MFPLCVRTEPQGNVEKPYQVHLTLLESLGCVAVSPQAFLFDGVCAFDGLVVSVYVNVCVIVWWW